MSAGTVTAVAVLQLTKRQKWEHPNETGVPIYNTVVLGDKLHEGWGIFDRGIFRNLATFVR